MIVIIDYGMGNLGSIRNMIRRMGGESVISHDENEIRGADKLILPGVGAFDHGMQKLHEMNIVPVLNEVVLEQKKPVLGICLGMQLLSNSSEEGELPGLGWIDSKTVKFSFDTDHQHLKIPHMGWNTVKVCQNSDLVDALGDEPRYYFVHSYHVVCQDPANELLKTEYGYEFVSGMYRDNIFGVQFHPEKSHKFGMQLFKNFIERV